VERIARKIITIIYEIMYSRMVICLLWVDSGWTFRVG
jgi:hypothetical protein